MPGVVIKVGGSLFDLPGLGPALSRWLKESVDQPSLLIPGGGPTTDVIRRLDRTHGLGEESSHWLALRTLAVNAYFLAAILPGIKVIDALGAWTDSTAILNPVPFFQTDERQADHLPHSWEVSSDSLALRVAIVAGARRLILLKSTALTPGWDWHEASRKSCVDAHFPRLANAAGVAIEVLDMRRWIVSATSGRD